MKKYLNKKLSILALFLTQIYSFSIYGQSTECISNPETNGIPLEFLKMIQTKTVAHRKKVSEAIINRGVKTL